MKKLSVVMMAILAIAFMGCNKGKLITLSETSATLHHGETYQIDAKCENPITYTSADEYYASVSETGLITANFIGSTTIALQSEEDSKTFSVTVDPRSDLYTEPNILFGETKEAVIGKLGTPAVDQGDAIAYSNYAPNAPILVVMFEDNCVEYYGVYVNPDYGDELNNVFLAERYYFIGTEDGINIFADGTTAETVTMIVGTELDEDGDWIAIYMAYEDLKANRHDALNALKAVIK